MKRHAPATLRNRAPILAVLRAILPERGTVLEIASGSGEHAVHFARALPGLTWQPSDPDPQARASIVAWSAEAGLPNLRAPLVLDVRQGVIAVPGLVAIVTINMVHIAPWAATVGMITAAGAALPVGGVLYLYGPYRRVGVPTAPSNVAFDTELREQDPSWGIRDLDALSDAATAVGLALDRVVEMPANNLSVVYRRSA